MSADQIPHPMDLGLHCEVKRENESLKAEVERLKREADVMRKALLAVSRIPRTQFLRDKIWNALHFDGRVEGG